MSDKSLKRWIKEQIEINGQQPYQEIEKGHVSIRMTDHYGIATDYHLKNQCPKCGGKYVNIGKRQGCYDGEWTYVDYFTCENKCPLTYSDLRG